MSDKIISQYLRLKDNHPTMVKLMKLYDCAEELGIHLSFHGGACTVYDRDRDPKLPFITIEDVDNHEALQEWPPATEFLCRYENPAALAQREKEYAEYLAERAAKQAKKEAEAKAARKLEEENALERQEALEKRELARLKTKYGE
jgi:hypothetical protein